MTGTTLRRLRDEYGVTAQAQLREALMRGDRMAALTALGATVRLLQLLETPDAG